MRLARDDRHRAGGEHGACGGPGERRERGARSPRNLRRRGARAITLVEVLLALGLALVLLSTVFIFVQDLVRARNRITTQSLRARAVDAFLESLEQAIAACMLDASGGAFVGTPTSCSVWSASTDPMGVFEAGAAPFPAAVRMTLGFEESDGSLRVRRGSGAEESLPAEAFALRFRYHDGTEWLDDFDGAERRRLPAAIEVSLWLRPWPDGMRPPWLPEPTREEDAAAASEERGLAAFQVSQKPQISDGDSSTPPRASARDSQTEMPVPDRMRIIAVPDSAPASLVPTLRRAGT